MIRIILGESLLPSARCFWLKVKDWQVVMQSSDKASVQVSTDTPTTGMPLQDFMYLVRLCCGPKPIPSKKPKGTCTP